MTAPMSPRVLSSPRPISDPVPVVWAGVAATILFAGAVGGGVAWLIARRWA